jgi:hypothetical protein
MRFASANSTRSFLKTAFSKLWWTPPTLAIVLLFLVFAPVYQYDFLYHDDWVQRLGTSFDCQSFPLAGFFDISGRPLGGAISCLGFSLVEFTEDARWVRLLTVVVIAGLLASVYGFLRREGMPGAVSALIAFGISVLPGCLALGYWLIAACVGYALLISTIAALLCQLASTGSMLTRSIALPTAVALEISACLCYQPGAMLFWVFAAISVAHSFTFDLKNLVRRLTPYMLVGVSAMIIYFAWFRWSGNAALLLQQDPSRGIMFTDMGGRIGWIVEEALPRALRLWFIDVNGLALPVAAGTAFLAAIIPFLIRRPGLKRAETKRRVVLASGLYIAVLLGLGLACIAPLLVTRFPLAAYRTLVPLSAFIFAMTISHVWLALPASASISRRIGPLALFAIAIIALYAHGALLRDMVLVAHAEFATYRQAISVAARLNPEQPVHVVVPPRLCYNFSNFTDEVHSLSSNHRDDIAPIVNVLRKEYGLAPVSVTSSIAGLPFDVGGRIVIDLTPLAQADVAAFTHVPFYPPGLTAGVRPAPPVFLRSVPTSDSFYISFDVIHYRDRYYGIPQTIGEARWQDADLDSLPCVFIGSTAEEVIAKLPR